MASISNMEKNKDISPSLHCQTFKEMFRNGIVNPKDINVSFENFPYYLSEVTKNILISSTYIHLKRSSFARFAGDLKILSQRVLLVGPVDTDIYMETLVKALARHFDAKILAVESLVSEAQSRKEESTASLNIFTYLKSVINKICCLRYLLMMRLAKRMSCNKHYRKLHEKYLLCREDKVEKVAIKELFEVAANEAKDSALIIHMKDFFISMKDSPYAYITLKTKLDNLPDNILVIGSHTFGDKCQKSKHDFLSPNQKLVQHLFQNNVEIQIPKDQTLLLEWKRQLNLDRETMKQKGNFIGLNRVLNQSGFECTDLQTVCMKDQHLSKQGAEYVTGWALSHHSMHATEEIIKDSKLLISSESIKYGMDLLETWINDVKSSKKSLKDVVTDNNFEKILLSEVIPPNEIGVSFDDIGAQEEVKDTLKVLVMLPLQRPELFTKGNLTKPCKGILLFGPPGTGKTMLAKAVATEAGANFINISMSTIASKWSGDEEKYAKAVFTLASKISPSVVFIDEVDSMNKSMRGMKNELMINWDGLRTKDNERVIVLAATNSPFDVDEAVIRRLTRRLMVGLPDNTNRRKILRVILSKDELVPNFDFETVARMTEGYTGSDLKNLCVTASLQPLREILDREKKKKELSLDENMPEPASLSSKDLRPLCLEDFRIALKQIGVSYSSDSVNTRELNEWNDLYGEGGSRRKTHLSYYN